MHIVIKDRRPLIIRNKEKVKKDMIRAYYNEECAQNPRMQQKSQAEIKMIKEAWESFPTDDRV